MTTSAPTITLYIDVKSAKDRFAICDCTEAAVWFGTFNATDRDYSGEQPSGEMACAKKALWLAEQAKKAIGAETIKLRLMTTAEWLTWANVVGTGTETGGKARDLGRAARRAGVEIEVDHIPAVENPAVLYTAQTGAKSYRDTPLPRLIDAADRSEPVAVDPAADLVSAHTIASSLRDAAGRSGDRGASEAQIKYLASLMADAGQDGSEYLLSTTIGLTKADASAEIDMLKRQMGLAERIDTPVKPAFSWVKEGASTFALRPGSYTVTRKRYGKSFRWVVKCYREDFRGVIETEVETEAQAKAYAEAQTAEHRVS